LDISDDGVGFNMDKIKLKGNEGLGIHNVYQLVNLLNGKVRYDSKVGKGTRIEIAFTNNQNYREQIV
jgi:signal transduction histidine kinase